MDPGMLIEEAALGAMGRGGGKLGITIPARRFRIAAWCTAGVIALLGGRCVHLQVVEGKTYLALAEGNRAEERVVPAPRGVIADRHGKVLARNVSSFMLTLTAGDLPDEDEGRSRVLDRAADLAGLVRTDIDLLLAEAMAAPDVPLPVKRGIPYEAAMRLAVETSRLPGFALETSLSRAYETGASSLSHVLGYTGRINAKERPDRPDYLITDDIGRSGVERGAELLLRGAPGHTVVEVDALGHELSLVSKTDPVPGANLILSIDADFQAYVEERVEATFRATGTSRASVVAIDPQTGGVRALVSLPSYDSNSFAQGIDRVTYQRLLDDPDQPLFPRAVSGEFPSGSVFKPFVAFAALKEGVISEHTSFLSSGGISVGPWYFPDWKAGGHGVTDVRKALADSVNTFFYIVGGGLDQVTGLGVERITGYARAFGFGQKTGIELPAEADGFLPSKEWKVEAKGEPWYVGDTYHLAIGQGDLLVTPLQMATAIAAIANGGQLVAPRLIEGIDGAAVTPASLPARREPSAPLDADLIRIVREGMRQGVTRGSSRSLLSASMNLAGKTGTAQTPLDKPTHAWWAGFGPYENPTLAVVVLIENGGEGSTVAVPIARDIFDWWALYGD